MQQQQRSAKVESEAGVVETQAIEAPKYVLVELPSSSRRCGRICCCLVPGCMIGPIVNIELGESEGTVEAAQRVLNSLGNDRVKLERYKAMLNAGLIKFE